jgi:hypothetical protein
VAKYLVAVRVCVMSVAFDEQHVLRWAVSICEALAVKSLDIDLRRVSGVVTYHSMW